MRGGGPDCLDLSHFRTKNLAPSPFCKWLQRYLPHFPAASEIVIFDRSWYNRAGVERVMGFCSLGMSQDPTTRNGRA